MGTLRLAALALAGCASHAAAIEDGAVLYARASTQADAGDREGALATLGRLPACWDLPPSDRDFAKLAGEPRYRALADQIGKREPRVHEVTSSFTFHAPALVPEGIAWDPATHRLFAGSMYRREIVVVEPGGEVRTFVGRDAGLDAVVGIRVDAEHGLLWATSDITRSMADARPDEPPRSAVASFDLATGALRAKFTLAAPGGGHLLNDLVVHRGDVYATDSESGIVWRLAGGSFASFATGFEHPNGIATDGNQLFVADDVAISTVRDGRPVRLPHPPCAPTGGVDGLYYDRDALYAVQNGLGHPRVVRMQLDAGHRAITAIDILESANPAFHAPTTAAIDPVDHRLLVLADSWLGSLDDRTHAPPPHDDTTILVIPLR